ncbi:MAG: DEAD/DEAH box helicase family protein, partial [Deltaproteobacteria bacterium]|nr:DEAD/DEAH box helicase family protein [Deltaproteobacteria bacterium]
MGCPVEIPFGKRKALGYALDLLETKPKSIGKTKSIFSFLHTLPFFNAKNLKFYQWIAHYYRTPLGIILKTALPAFKNYKPLKENKNIYVLESPYSLQQEQKTAFDSIVTYVEQQRFVPILLHGVTGSGKTEVYLQLIQKALDHHQSALLLVPEISLTPQMECKLLSRFGDKLTVYHSRLSQRQRYWNWRKMQLQQPHVVLGTRSSLFSPLENIGIIIVDEEHDSSFKQETGLLY